MIVYLYCNVDFIDDELSVDKKRLSVHLLVHETSLEIISISNLYWNDLTK